MSEYRIQMPGNYPGEGIQRISFTWRKFLTSTLIISSVSCYTSASLHLVLFSASSPIATMFYLFLFFIPVRSRYFPDTSNLRPFHREIKFHIPEKRTGRAMQDLWFFVALDIFVVF